MLRVLSISICSVMLLLSSCHEQEPNYFFDCYKEGKEEIIDELISDFESQLNATYSKDDFVENILLYLQNFQDSTPITILKPNAQLAILKQTKDLIQDIWDKKSLRPTSELIRCLNQSKKQNIIDYLGRLATIGDMAIDPVSKGAINLLIQNREIDSEFKPILTINFYLIWLNESDFD